MAGSLLVPVTLNEPGARPDNASAAVTVAGMHSDDRGILFRKKHERSKGSLRPDDDLGGARGPAGGTGLVPGVPVRLDGVAGGVFSGCDSEPSSGRFRQQKLG